VNRYLFGLFSGLLMLGTTLAGAQDVDELHRQGSAARRDGHFTAAVAKLGEAARLRPNDADVQLELGLALTPLRKFDDAEKALRRALELAPGYLDAKLGLARIAFFRGRFESARHDIVAILVARPADNDAKALMAQVDRAIAGRAAARRAAQQRAAAQAVVVENSPTPPPKVPRWRLDLDGGGSQLTGGRKPWLELNGRLGYAVTPDTTVSGGVDVFRRYGIVDTYMEGRVDHKAAPGLSGFIYAGGTPDAHYRPKVQVGGGVSARLYQQSGIIAATVFTLEGRYSEYVTGQVRTVKPGIEQYLFDGKVWITAQSINTVDEFGRYQGGYLARGDLMLRDDLRVFVGYSDAPENSDGYTVETRALFGGVVYDVNASTALRLSLSHEQRATFNRTTAGIGATHKF
jgi:YaiO family outer membrane protein